MSDLTILCVTDARPHSARFIAEMAVLAGALSAHLALVADGDEATERIRDAGYFCQTVKSTGDIGSVLDEALDYCPPGYVLRLDDDETASPALMRWLTARDYRAADHWRFPRMWLWPSMRSFITNAPVWPDHQTRLSIKEKSGNRPLIHQGSPYGAGELAPFAVIEHWKLLLHTLEERRAIVARYDSLQADAGTLCRSHYVPEDFFEESLKTANVAEAIAA